MSTSKVNPPGYLPVPLSAFIGRERELAEVKRLLSVHRLVTLTGAGGSGKTRLAIKVANELSGGYRDGIWFIELASLTEPALVPQRIAATLKVHESSARPLMDSLVDHLATRALLLVVDNCEHLISTCAEIAETLLQKCLNLTLLATSREPLNIPGEIIWNVSPLSLPALQPWRDTASEQRAISVYEQSEAIQLFVDRAGSVSADFSLTVENGAAVAEICRRLDGMPLAIELAAARVRSLSVQQIAQRLDDRFHLLTEGARTAPPRQQTLAATLDWSYNLLSNIEQKVLQRLSVFASGATLEAAEAVCSDPGEDKNIKNESVEETSPHSSDILDVVSHLVDKSLVTADRPERGETRYRLLETIRQYALEKLTESDELEKSKNRHLNYFIQWAEMAEPQLSGPQQLEWFERYETEHDNLRTALEWCNADDPRAGLGLRLVLACSRFWRSRGYLSEGRTRISDALARANELQSEARARALFWSASLAYLQSDYPATRLMGEESLAIWRELDDGNKPRLADTLDLLGELATEEGDYETALSLLEEALEIYKGVQDVRGFGDMHMQLGWAYMRLGQYEQARIHMEEALIVFRQIDHESLMGFTLGGLGELAIRQGQYDRAARLLEESLSVRKKHGHKWGIGASLGSLGWVALCQRDFKRLRMLLTESLSVRLEINDQGGIAWCLEKLAEAKQAEAQFEQAVKIFGYAESVRMPIGSVIDPVDQPDYDRLISNLQSALGPETFAALWAEGKATRLDDVIDLALSESMTESSRAEKEKFGGLTAREREVAALIARGKSNREIAEVMTVGVKTVETYVTRILNKLGFDSRVQIATWAIEKGLR